MGAAGARLSPVGTLTGASLRIGFAANELVAAAGKFLDGAALFEFIEHAEKGAGVGLPEVKSSGDFGGGSGAIGNLKKTKDIIGVEV